MYKNITVYIYGLRFNFLAYFLTIYEKAKWVTRDQIERNLRRILVVEKMISEYFRRIQSVHPIVLKNNSKHYQNENKARNTVQFLPKQKYKKHMKIFLTRRRGKKKKFNIYFVIVKTAN